MNDNVIARVTVGRHFGIPYARILHGSVVQRTFLGLTRWHAIRRADRHLSDCGLTQSRFIAEERYDAHRPVLGAPGPGIHRPGSSPTDRRTRPDRGGNDITRPATGHRAQETRR